MAQLTLAVVPLSARISIIDVSMNVSHIIMIHMIIDLLLLLLLLRLVVVVVVVVAAAAAVVVVVVVVVVVAVVVACELKADNEVTQLTCLHIFHRSS